MSGEYWLSIEGSGSFSLGKGQPIWRGKNKITAEQAEAVLAWKDKHPGIEWLTLSIEDPAPDEPPPETHLPMLRLADFHRPSDPPVFELTEELSDADEAPYDDGPEFFCTECEIEFPNHARLRRHLALHHGDVHLAQEEAVRAQIAAERAVRAAEPTPGRLNPDCLHPSEREPLELPPSPPLWPQMPGSL